jgi:hypothetical protein
VTSSLRTGRLNHCAIRSEVGYEALCAFCALFQLQVLHYYQMERNRRTDENSILFNAALLLRLIAPVGFNFCQITNVSGTEFQAVVGRMDVVPFFGSGFTVYFPILVSLVCAVTLFNVFARLAKLLGVTQGLLKKAHHLRAVNAHMATTAGNASGKLRGAASVVAMMSLAPSRSRTSSSIRTARSPLGTPAGDDSVTQPLMRSVRLESERERDIPDEDV